MVAGLPGRVAQVLTPGQSDTAAHPGAGHLDLPVRCAPGAPACPLGLAHEGLLPMAARSAVDDVAVVGDEHDRSAVVASLRQQVGQFADVLGRPLAPGTFPPVVERVVHGVEDDTDDVVGGEGLKHFGAQPVAGGPSYPPLWKSWAVRWRFFQNEANPARSALCPPSVG